MSELRQDLISGDWTIIAPGRSARPQMLEHKRPPRKAAPKKGCPFEDLSGSQQEEILFALPNKNQWQVVLTPNKYPALVRHAGVCSSVFHQGIYAARTGVGDHYLIITRDHNKNFLDISPKLAHEVFALFQKLCRQTLKDPCATYAVPFFNWGPLAGASVWHPHYQFLSLPIIPAHSGHSLRTEKAYFKKHHRCGRCDVIAFEKKAGVRIVDENKHAIAIAPYASKYPFEITIMPKKHSSYFYGTSAVVIDDIAGLLKSVMQKLKKNVNDPDINMFIHESPLDGKRHDYHHWHMEIIPRVSTPAGFEFSTGIYINTVEPEQATKILRGENSKSQAPNSK